MKLWQRKKPESPAPRLQIREGNSHPFGALERYRPLGQGDMALYRSIREAVPIVDAAVMKLVRLCGGVKVTCADRRGQAGLDRFLRTVDTGRGQRGIQSFLDRYLDDMLTYGRGVGEIVLDGRGREIAALLCADPGAVDIKEGDSPLDFRLCARGETGQPEELPAAAVHPLPAGGGGALWNVPAAVHALSDGDPAEDLPVGGPDLGAGGHPPVRRGMQAG